MIIGSEGLDEPQGTTPVGFAATREPTQWTLSQARSLGEVHNGRKIIEGLHEAVAYARGEPTSAKVRVTHSRLLARRIASRLIALSGDGPMSKTVADPKVRELTQQVWSLEDQIDGAAAAGTDTAELERLLVEHLQKLDETLGKQRERTAKHHPKMQALLDATEAQNAKTKAEHQAEPQPGPSGTP